MWPFRKKQEAAEMFQSEYDKAHPKPDMPFEFFLSVGEKATYVVPHGWRRVNLDEYTAQGYEDAAYIGSPDRQKWIPVSTELGKQIMMGSWSYTGNSPWPQIVPMLFNYEAMSKIPAYVEALNEFYTPKVSDKVNAWNEWGYNPYDERHFKAEESKLRDEPAFCDCDPKKMLRQCKK